MAVDLNDIFKAIKEGLTDGTKQAIRESVENKTQKNIRDLPRFVNGTNNHAEEILQEASYKKFTDFAAKAEKDRIANMTKTMNTKRTFKEGTSSSFKTVDRVAEAEQAKLGKYANYVAEQSKLGSPKQIGNPIKNFVKDNKKELAGLGVAAWVATEVSSGNTKKTNAQLYGF